MNFNHGVDACAEAVEYIADKGLSDQRASLKSMNFILPQKQVHAPPTSLDLNSPPVSRRSGESSRAAQAPLAKKHKRMVAGMWDSEEIEAVKDKVEKEQKKVGEMETALELQREKGCVLQKEVEIMIKSNELRVQRQSAKEEEVLEEGKCAEQ